MFLWQLNFIVGQIHRASNKNSYQIKYDRYYPNASEQFTYFKPLNTSENLTRMPSMKVLSEYNLNLEIFLNSTLNRISDLLFIENRDFNLLFDGKLSVWLFSILGTLLVGASGIMPVIIMPHLIKDHTKLGKYLL